MEPYAVVETGGKQYKVAVGDKLDIELLDAEVGAQVKLDRVLACSDGAALKVGKPLVDGATVTVEVIKARRGPKVISFKKKRRKGYERKVGHRQDLLRVNVVSISAA